MNKDFSFPLNVFVFMLYFGFDHTEKASIANHIMWDLYYGLQVCSDAVVV